MRARSRRLAALIALIALTASMAEQGWAAACTDMDAGSTVVMDVRSDGGLHAAHLSISSTRSVTDPEPSGSDSSTSCPMAVVSGMACGMVALGSLTAVSPASTNEGDTLLAASEDSLPSGALSFLFRPPRR